MMPRRTWALATLLFGCTGVLPRDAPAEVPDPAPAPARVTIPDAGPPPPTPAPEATPALPACTYDREAPTEFAAATAPTGGACRTVPKAALRDLTTHIRKEWMRSWPNSRLEIRPGCDRLDAQLDSVVLVTSGGHGGSLTLARFDRLDGGEYDLVLLEYNHYFGGPAKDRADPWQADSAGRLRVSRAKLGAAVMTRLLDRLRAAAHVEIEEHEPPPRRDGTFFGMAGSSSHDYHVALRLADGRGHGVERFFAGYASSGKDQRDGVPLAFASRVAREVLDPDGEHRKSFQSIDAADPAARDLFARVFWAARARGDDYGYWYVRERLLGMAALLGSGQHVPALLAQLRIAGEHSILRSATLAVNAIAAITKFDVRYDPDRKPRPLAAVVADTLAACERR